MAAIQGLPRMSPSCSWARKPSPATTAAFVSVCTFATHLVPMSTPSSSIGTTNASAGISASLDSVCSDSVSD